MVTNSFSSGTVEMVEQDQIPASGRWSFDEELPKQPPSMRAPSGRFSKTLALVLAIPVLSSVVDPWIDHDRRQLPVLSQTAQVDPPDYQVISIREAGELALAILAEAEADRLRIADEEARRALQLEDV